MNRNHMVLAAAALMLPALARADRRELFTQADVAPILFHLNEPVRGSQSTNKLGLEASGSIYYGLTNSIHAGAALHYSFTRDARFDGTTVTLQDGTVSNGTNFADPSSMSATALLNYRLNSGTPLTVLAQIEGGFAWLSYNKIAHEPAGQNYFIAFPDDSETRLELRGSLRADYRFREHLLIGAGAGYIAHPGAKNPWSLYFPVTVGWVW